MEGESLRGKDKMEDPEAAGEAGGELDRRGTITLPQQNETSIQAPGLVAFAIIGYATCSSLMLIVNKIAVHVLPAPSFVLLAQLVTSALSVWIAGVFGWVVVDRLEWKKV